MPPCHRLLERTEAAMAPLLAQLSARGAALARIAADA